MIHISYFPSQLTLDCNYLSILDDALLFCFVSNINVFQNLRLHVYFFPIANNKVSFNVVYLYYIPTPTYMHMNTTYTTQTHRQSGRQTNRHTHNPTHTGSKGLLFCFASKSLNDLGCLLAFCLSHYFLVCS